MKLTLSVIKADIGSVGGHIAPSEKLLRTVRDTIVLSRNLIRDHYISHTGDDIAILMTHDRGVGDREIHKLAWDAFIAGTATAKAQGLYGAGQDLLKEAMLPMSELEYTGITERLKGLDGKFQLRGKQRVAAA